MSKSWLGKQDYEHALQQLNRAEALGGTHATATIHILRGYALMGQQRFEQAAKGLEAYLSRRAQWAACRTSAGSVSADQNRYGDKFQRDARSRHIRAVQFGTVKKADLKGRPCIQLARIPSCDAIALLREPPPTKPLALRAR